MSKVPARYLSPLRYPGGKGRLAKYVGALLESQFPRPSRYVEPFAGGAGVGLRLLVDEYVDEIVINDLNPGIAAFWRAVFDRPEDFLTKLNECDVTIDEWKKQRQVYLSQPTDDVVLGFALFFLTGPTVLEFSMPDQLAAMTSPADGRSMRDSTAKVSNRG